MLFFQEQIKSTEIMSGKANSNLSRGKEMSVDFILHESGSYREQAIPTTGEL